MRKGNDFRVLLVEDNPDHAIIAKMALKKIDKISHVEHVDNGKKALDYFFDPQSSARLLPNLTILDLNLPELDGFEVLKEIRNDKNLRNLPVVILTTSKNECDVKKALELGVAEYFIKPLNIDRLTEILNSIDEIKNISNDNLNWRTMSFIR
ncbi:MAG: response regulator [Candidatus Delongbacteria bacterium]|nr:response regulator [Candidatus Delongbacteria bacterium]